MKYFSSIFDYTNLILTGYFIFIPGTCSIYFIFLFFYHLERVPILLFTSFKIISYNKA